MEYRLSRGRGTYPQVFYVHLISDAEQYLDAVFCAAKSSRNPRHYTISRQIIKGELNSQEIAQSTDLAKRRTLKRASKKAHSCAIKYIKNNIKEAKKLGQDVTFIEEDLEELINSQIIKDGDIMSSPTIKF